MNLYQPKHFVPQEFIPPEVYETLRGQSLLVMDSRILKTVDAIREFFGKPVVINNWHIHTRTVGQFRFRGFRPPTWKGTTYSQHRFGRAIDFHIPGIQADDIRTVLLNERVRFPYITAMEIEVGWIHIDCRPIADGEPVFLFKG